MNAWTLAWLLWLGAFAVIEGAAVLLRGSTLSQHVWRWFAVTDTAAATRWRRAMLVLGLLWLSAHCLTGGHELGVRMWNDVMGELLKAVLASVTPVIAGLVVALLVQLLRRFNLELSAEQQAKFEALVRREIQRVEEYFAAKVKAGHPVTAAQKMENAIAAIQAAAPDKTREQIAGAIQSKLAETPWGASESFPQAGAVVVASAPGV